MLSLIEGVESKLKQNPLEIKADVPLSIIVPWHAKLVPFVVMTLHDSCGSSKVFTGLMSHLSQESNMTIKNPEIKMIFILIVLYTPNGHSMSGVRWSFVEKISGVVKRTICSVLKIVFIT